MRLVGILLFLISSLYSYAQETFSKLIDLELAIDNSLTDLEISDEFLYVSASHLCKNDTDSNILYQCTSISKYDFSANIINKVLLDSFFPEGSNRLLLENGNLFLTGHFHGEFNARPTILLELNDSLGIDSMYEFPSDSGTVPNNEGLQSFNNSLYFYGTKLVNNENKKYSNIIKVGKLNKTVQWDKIYSRADWKNECYDLQNTIDGKLIFVQYFNDGVGSGGESGFQIVEIDTMGIVRDSFEFEDIGVDNPRILASREGSIYFTSQDPPFPHTIPSNGRINKISSDLENLEWSLELPSNPFIDAHRFKIYDYLQALNGDILACGTVWDEGPDGPLGTPNNHTWNGFIVRVTQYGDLKWLKIYRHPNILALLPTNEYGDFRPSLLNKIYETSDSNFIVGGTVYYNSEQDAALPSNENKSSIWLMTVDKNGCINGEECTETIILNNKNDLAPKYKIGTYWVYEVEEGPFPILTSFQTFQITDTLKISGKNVFVIENDYNNSKEYMLIDDAKVYFWDNKLDSFQLNYNFAENNQYETPWVGACNQDSGLAIIYVDSITSYVLNSDSLHIQHLSIENNGTSDESIKVSIYKNIGLKDGGMKLPLGYNFCDFNRGLTKLRCFESDSINYNFVGYPCDSIWFSTALKNFEDERQLIYPNPSSGLIKIKGQEKNGLYELFDLLGKQVQSGNIIKNEINVNHKGLYILRIFMDSKWFTIRVLII